MSRVQSVQINLRVPGQVMADLDHLAQEERVARIDLARKILLEGVAQRKRELALRLYREGKASKSRAAEIAGISLWELLDLAAQAELLGRDITALPRCFLSAAAHCQEVAATAHWRWRVRTLPGTRCATALA